MGLGGLQLAAQGSGFLAGCGGLRACTVALRFSFCHAFGAAVDFLGRALALFSMGLLGGNTIVACLFKLLRRHQRRRGGVLHLLFQLDNARMRGFQFARLRLERLGLLG